MGEGNKSRTLLNWIIYARRSLLLFLHSHFTCIYIYLFTAFLIYFDDNISSAYSYIYTATIYYPRYIELLHYKFKVAIITSQRLVQTTSINTKIAGIWSSIFYYYETGAYSNWFHKLNCILIRLDQPEQIYYHWLQYRCICCCAEELARIDVDSADTRAPMCGSGGGGLPIMLQRTLDINCPLPVWWWYAPSSRGGGGSIGRPQLGCWWGSPISPCPPGIVIWFTLWLRSSGIGRGGS